MRRTYMYVYVCTHTHIQTHTTGNPLEMFEDPVELKMKKLYQALHPNPLNHKP